jgi:hypothetical protein
MEQLLRCARPQASPEFVCDLEASLVSSVRPRGLLPRRSASPRARRLVVALGGAGALATAMLVLSIAGVRPLGTGGTTGAEADQRCTTVTEWVVRREPMVTVTPGGRLHLDNQRRIVPEQRLRCR